jgi:hypothetical protein
MEDDVRLDGAPELVRATLGDEARFLGAADGLDELSVRVVA